MPQNVFLLLSKYPLVVSLKNFFKNKAILIIVIGLKNILHWNLVESALDKEDRSVPVYFPFFILFYYYYYLVLHVICLFSSYIYIYIYIYKELPFC